MNTYGKDLMGRRRRRRHSTEFKAAVIHECLQPGVSIAAVALAHSLKPTCCASGSSTPSTPPARRVLSSRSHQPRRQPRHLPSEARLSSRWHCPRRPWTARSASSCSVSAPRSESSGLQRRPRTVRPVPPPHHAYVFANKRSTRLKVLVHDGLSRSASACGRPRMDYWSAHMEPNMMTAIPRKQRPTPTQSVVVGVTLSTSQSQSMATPMYTPP